MIEFKGGFASPELVVISLIIICMITTPWVTLSCLTFAYIAMIPYGAYCYKQQKRKELAQNEQEDSIGENKSDQSQPIQKPLPKDTMKKK